jgi:hypothetical protein
MNDALFMLLLWAAQSVMDILHTGGNAQTVTRVAVSTILVAAILWVVRRPVKGPEGTGHRFLFVTGALFLLSPTQFPWYFLWMLPFLALFPRVSLLLLTPLLSLYYIRYYFLARDLAHIHDNGVVWFEYVPVWGLLLWEWAGSIKRKRHFPESRENAFIE